MRLVPVDERSDGNIVTGEDFKMKIDYMAFSDKMNKPHEASTYKPRGGFRGRGFRGANYPATEDSFMRRNV